MRQKKSYFAKELYILMPSDSIFVMPDFALVVI
jgi:hypothetical protein